MVVVQKKPQVQVFLLVQPAETIVKGLGHVSRLSTAGHMTRGHVGVHAIPLGRNTRREKLGLGRDVKVPAGPTPDLVYGFVGRVQDHASPQLACQKGLLFAREVPLLYFLRQASKRQRVGRGEVGLEQGAAAGFGGIVRYGSVLSSYPPLEVMCRYLVVVLGDIVDARRLGEAKAFERGKVLRKGGEFVLAKFTHFNRLVSHTTQA